MKNSTYFKWNEMTRSNTATKYHIQNEPNEEESENLEYLMDYLDSVRAKYGKPIYVTSGYRNAEVNRLVRGAKNSQHTKGQAADLNTGSISGNIKLFDLIRYSFEFDQLINESNYSWVHVSIRKDGKNRHQILKT